MLQAAKEVREPCSYANGNETQVVPSSPQGLLVIYFSFSITDLALYKFSNYYTGS